VAACDLNFSPILCENPQKPGPLKDVQGAGNAFFISSTNFEPPRQGNLEEAQVAEVDRNIRARCGAAEPFARWNKAVREDVAAALTPAIEMDPDFGISYYNPVNNLFFGTAAF